VICSVVDVHLPCATTLFPCSGYIDRAELYLMLRVCILSQSSLLHAFFFFFFFFFVFVFFLLALLLCALADGVSGCTFNRRGYSGARFRRMASGSTSEETLCRRHSGSCRPMHEFGDFREYQGTHICGILSLAVYKSVHQPWPHIV
jgi:hypothetical protein